MGGHDPGFEAPQSLPRCCPAPLPVNHPWGARLPQRESRRGVSGGFGIHGASLGSPEPLAASPLPQGKRKKRGRNGGFWGTRMTALPVAEAGEPDGRAARAAVRAAAGRARQPCQPQNPPPWPTTDPKPTPSLPRLPSLVASPQIPGAPGKREASRARHGASQLQQGGSDPCHGGLTTSQEMVKKRGPEK